MPEFRYLTRPVFSPTACALCGATDVPVIDTGVERDVIGRVYLCCKPDPTSTNNGCAEQIALTLGFSDPDSYREILDELADTHEMNETLKLELEKNDQPLVVYAEDLRTAMTVIVDELLDSKRKKK